VPVIAVAGLEQLVQFLEERSQTEQAAAIRAYRAQYGAS
jgi:hypothetical protein